MVKDSESEKPNRWKLWKSFNFLGKKFSHAEREAGRRLGLGGAGKNAMVQEERAAIYIQTAFRVFLAKKALRALKGLARLQAAITGHDTPKQSSLSLHCIQAFVRVQARIHRQRAGKRGEEVPSLVVEKCTSSSEADWCNALGTIEEIQAKEQQRQVAAVKRERAIAYAFCNKWKANTKINPGSLFDYELDNSTWVWIWLDEWLNGQSKKPSARWGDGKQNVRMMGARKKNMAAVGILNCKVGPDKSYEGKGVHARVGSPGRFRLARSVSGGRGGRVKALSPKPNGSLHFKSSRRVKQQPRKEVKAAFLDRSK